LTGDAGGRYALVQKTPDAADEHWLVRRNRHGLYAVDWQGATGSADCLRYLLLQHSR
jgi:hypothetical protein